MMHIASNSAIKLALKNKKNKKVPRSVYNTLLCRNAQVWIRSVAF